MKKNIFPYVLFLCCFFSAIISFSCSFVGKADASTLISADPVVSRNVPAFTSDDCAGSHPASLANNSSYDDQWRSCNATPSASVPVTLTYDMSGVASASRKNVVLAWYNDPATGAYDHTLISVNAYNIPGDYTIQANAAAGGGSPPASGWTTLATVTGNVYHSRQHSLNLTGYNWVRLSVTRSEGSVLNFDVAVNMDIHDVSGGTTDDWIFFGDSITQQAFLHNSTYGGTFSKSINTFNSSYFPVYESGGLGGFLAADGAANINTWLPLFPGKFVTLNYGTNDANGMVSGTTFYNNMKTLVQAVINAGKIPIIPTIPWGCTANITNTISSLNAKITQLYSDFPQIIKGPDLYTFFSTHQSEISGDCIHPTDPAGYTDYLTQWVNSVETSVYTAPSVSTSPVGGSVSSAQAVTLTASKTGSTIYFTTDGSTPTTASTVYSSPITISATKTLKALAVDQAGNQSDIATNTYTFATSSTASSSTVSSPVSSVSIAQPSNPNILPGWSKVISVGPHFFGTPSFISGSLDASGAQTFIDPYAVHDDINVSIQKSNLDSLISMPSPIPFPWAHGYNTVSDIYNYSVTSAFNGYPIPSFDKPVTIILPFTQSLLPQGEKPFLAWYNLKIQRWEILPNNVINWQTHTIATTTKQYSYFAVVYPSAISKLTSQSTTLGTETKRQDDSATLEMKITTVTPTPEFIKSESVQKKTLPHKSCLLFICW